MKVQTIKKHSSKGITLVALVVTIIVLLILAGVTIMTLFGENGLITMAQKAKSETENAQANDIAGLDSLINELNSILNGTSGGTSGEGPGGGDIPVNPDPPTPPADDPTKVANNLNKVITGENADLTDKYGNKITVPVGFKIVTPTTENKVEYKYDKVDGTSTNIPVVQDGIVIENDADGNQFVWVPVGDINNDAEENTDNKTTITLGRYSNFTMPATGTPTPAQKASKTAYDSPTKIEDDQLFYYIEISSDFAGNGTYKSASEYGNTKATNLREWISTTIDNGGYYIARYEASQNGTKAASTAGKTVWASVKQRDAATYAKATYPVNGTNKDNYYSDLINSYAWDTAIIFIQAYANSTYASTNNSKNVAGNNAFVTTGANTDNVCNINAMSGNASEWSTESSADPIVSDADVPCTLRGGCCNSNGGGASYCASYRSLNTLDDGGIRSSFRLTLYVK